jgi:lipopolysaccharide biosynthesis glycosyltransferase
MTDRTIAIAATVDEEYVRQLLVVVGSACRGLSAGRAIRLFVLGYRIGQGTRAWFEAGVAELPVEVEWLTLELEAVRGFWPAAEGGGVTLYYRMYLGEALPDEIHRVIFLDADVLVEGDLAELWQSPFEGKTVQAVADAYAAKSHLPRLGKIHSEGRPLFTGSTPYFNAGVLLVDLERWRREDVGTRAAAFLWNHGYDLASRDQDALNCALVGRWKPLSIAWNFHELPKALREWKAETSGEELRQAIRSPKIIHFIGCKPWGEECFHIWRELWWDVAVGAGFPRVPLAFWDRVFRAPLHHLHWYIWRGIAQAGDWSYLGRIARLLLARPWMAATYPAWKLLAWLRYQSLGGKR